MPGQGWAWDSSSNTAHQVQISMSESMAIASPYSLLQLHFKMLKNHIRSFTYTELHIGREHGGGRTR
jgi:hypothetical protein